jgi:seryl-tRNA(Sec) selenium transferase
MPVLAPAQYKKKLLSFEQLSSLYSICAAGIVFPQTSLSLSRALRAFAPTNRSTLSLLHRIDYFGVITVCRCQ